MSDPERFEYTSVGAQVSEAGFLPQLPLVLTNKLAAGISNRTL